MRVGLVRKVALGAIALVAVGMAGCDENPLVFSNGVAVLITTNPSVMTIPAGVTTLLQSRTVDEGNRPTWDEITPSVDATCGGASVIVETAATYEPEIQPPGVFDVTGGNTIGTTCIDLSGGGVTASVAVTVVGDSLEIIGPGAGGAVTSPMVVFDTQQLTSALLADDGTPVAPFDPLTDITWSSDNDGIASVDATGLVTANGAGTATITATWSMGGVTVSAEVAIAVEVPPPVLTSIDVATADAGDAITITGTGMLVGPHAIYVNGFEVAADPLLGPPTVVDATTATFNMPPGAPGDVDVQVGSVVGGLSNIIVVTRTSDDYEPDNDDQEAGGPTITIPANIVNYFDGTAGDTDDYYGFTLGAGATLNFALDWVGVSTDLDLYVIDRNPVTNFQCGFAGGTLSKPEAFACALGAGDFAAWVVEFDHVPGLTQYTMTITP